jgi:uncharacterized protein (DUF58 family)
MLLRLITVISLILFMLLMISGVNVDVALYRSILVFMILFTVVYLSMFLLNVIRDNNNQDNMSYSGGNNHENKAEN